MVDIADFLSFISVKKGLSKSSQKHCRIRVGLYVKYLTQYNKKLCSESTEEFIYYLQTKKQVNNNTLNTYYFSLRQLQDYLKDRGSDLDILGSLKSFKKTKPLITILTPQEIDQLLKCYVYYGKYRGRDVTPIINKNFGGLTMFLAYTGCRFSEAASLTCRYIDLVQKTAIFIETKNKEFRRVFLCDELVSILKELMLERGDDDFVFVNAAHNRINPQDYDLYLKKIKEQSGIKKRVHPHIFRHSFATQLLMSGADVTYVAKLLGHKDIQTTYNNYVHLADLAIKRTQFKHPLLRRSLEPKDVINEIKETIRSAGIEDDRFKYELTDKGVELMFKIEFLGKES